MKIKLIATVTVILFIIVSAASAFYVIKQAKNQTPLPVIGNIQPFTLIDTQGGEFTRSRLKDKIWIADFIFTTCAGVCPIMSKNMASLHRSYRLVDDVRFVSISVNPEYDSPAVMKEYSTRYDADLDQWHFLTGQQQSIKELAVNSFKIGSAEDPVFHSTKLVLVDRLFRIRGYYDGTDEKAVQALFIDLARLLKEKQ